MSTHEPLPPAPAGKTGWPWTAAPQRLPATLPDGSRWPTLRIVTPSYNQGEFVEETIRSVLLQGYPALEYVVVDGGSTDGTREVLERYSPWLTDWVSEPDGGQYDAINTGLSAGVGEIMAWINSDDRYAPGAFAAIGEVFSRLPQVEWVTSLRPIALNARGRATWCRRLGGFAREGFRGAEYVVGVGSHSSAWIPQESTFWRRSLWERTGAKVDASLRMAGDFELWNRFSEAADLYGIEARLAGFRHHRRQKTARDLPLYVREATEVFVRRGGRAHGRRRALARKGLSRLPRPLRWPLLAVGLAYRAKIIARARDGKGWVVRTVPV